MTYDLVAIGSASGGYVCVPASRDDAVPAMPAHHRRHDAMPTVAIVEGVKIQFYPNDHPPPHFHAELAEHRAVIDIATLRMSRGSLPSPKLRAVLAWAASRQGVLTATFARAISKQPLEPVP